MRSTIAILAFAATGFAIDAKLLADRAPGATVTQISDGELKHSSF